MRRLVLAGALVLTGCQSVVGPFGHRKPERVDDPLLSISEQQRRGRANLPLPDTASAAGPASGVYLPGNPYSR